MKTSKEEFQKIKKENQRLKNLNQELEKQIEKLKEDKKSQDKRFEKIQIKNNLLENKIAQIQKEASRLSEKQSQVEEVKAVPAAVQKEEKQTTHMPYINSNYNRHFDQRRGQNEHSQKSFIDKQTVRHTKQQLRRPISQNNLRGPIKIDLGWTTTDTM